MNQIDNKHRKVLLMGQYNAGKTSINSVIFENITQFNGKFNEKARDIAQNQFLDIKNNEFLGNFIIQLWDFSGSCASFQEQFKAQQREIYSNVEVLVYVCNAEKKDELFAEEMNDFHKTVKQLSQFSPRSSVFVLIHKFDKVKDNEKQQVFDYKYREIMARSEGLNIKIKKILQTSIWEETLYKAWSEIAQSLIPNFQLIKGSLKSFCQFCGCEEIALFERSTFLLIQFWKINEEEDILKYERIANSLKQFTLSCQKKQANINNIVIKSKNFSVYIDEFTETTFIMLRYTDPSIQSAALAHNIANVRKIFDSTKGCDFEKLKIYFENN